MHAHLVVIAHVAGELELPRCCWLSECVVHALCSPRRQVIHGDVHERHFVQIVHIGAHAHGATTGRHEHQFVCALALVRDNKVVRHTGREGRL
jgi:hypothetical protein